MSETTNRPEQSRGRAQATRAAMREATQSAEEVVKAAADGTNEIIGNAADTLSHTTEVAQRVADQSREVMWNGMRAAAGVNSRLADVGYGTSHRFFEQATRIMDVYGQASDRATEKLQSLFAASLSLSRGAQQMQQTWFNLLDRSVNEAVRKPQDLLRCKSFSEMADTQRDLYIGAIDRAIESSATMLQAAERTARDALSRLQNLPRPGSSD